MSASNSPSGAVSSAVDPAYEFDAPRFRDFREADDPNTDTWFDGLGAEAKGAAAGESFGSDATLPEIMEEADAPLPPLNEAEVKAADAAAVAMADAAAVRFEKEHAAQEAEAEETVAAEEAPIAAAEAQMDTEEAIAPAAAAATTPTSIAELRKSMPLTEPAALNKVRQSFVQQAKEHKALDAEVEALQQSLVQETTAATAAVADVAPAAAAAQIAEPIEAAALELPAQQPIDEELHAAMEDSVAIEDSQPVVSLAAAFAAVADTPIATRSAAKRVAQPTTARTPGAAAAADKSVPSFLRPTAAAAARAAAIADASMERSVQQPHLKPMQISTRVVQPTPAASLPATTPRVNNKRRGVSVEALEALSRPRTASKPRAAAAQEREPSISRPSTAVKAKQQPQKEYNAHKVTVAQSPALSTRTRARVNPSLLSSEEEEVRRIAAEREEMAKAMKRTAALHEVLAHAPADAPVPMRSAAPLTHPEEFQFLTAKRAKTAPSSAAPSEPSTSRRESHAGDHLFVTKPQPFTFQTDRRLRRDPTVLSREEQELAELAAIKPFKALPLREDVLHSGGQIGVPRINKAKPTEATSPQLATAARCKRKQQEQEHEQHEPAIAPASAAEVKEAPASKSAKKPRREVQPFHFATDDRAKSDFRIRHEAAAAAESGAAPSSKFVARPLSAVVHALPAAPVLTVPLVEPHCVFAHKESQARLQAQVAEEEAAMRAAREFKARPNPFAHGAAATAPHDALGVTQAIKSDKPLTVAHTPALSSKERAARRAQYDAEQAEREATLAALQAEMQAESEASKARELKQLRAALKPATTELNKAILAQPDFVAKPSRAPLTQPESPMLITKRRANKTSAAKFASRMEQLDEEENVQPSSGAVVEESFPELATAAPAADDAAVAAIIAAPPANEIEIA